MTKNRAEDSRYICWSCWQWPSTKLWPLSFVDNQLLSFTSSFGIVCYCIRCMVLFVIWVWNYKVLYSKVLHVNTDDKVYSYWSSLCKSVKRNGDDDDSSNGFCYNCYSDHRRGLGKAIRGRCIALNLYRHRHHHYHHHHQHHIEPLSLKWLSPI